MVRTPRILTGSNSHSTAAAPPPSEAVNVESDMVIILAALLCALICMVGLIAVARCAWLRRINGAARSPSQASANKGIKKKNLQLLPKFTYTTTSPTTETGGPTKFTSSECAICLGEFVEGDEVRVLPQCGHGFHVGCIDTWLGSHSSCPSCRQILVVTRCQKCGQFPAVSSSSSFSRGGAATEAELKAGEDNNNRRNNHSHNNATFLP